MGGMVLLSVGMWGSYWVPREGSLPSQWGPISLSSASMSSSSIFSNEMICWQIISIAVEKNHCSGTASGSCQCCLRLAWLVEQLPPRAPPHCPPLLPRSAPAELSGHDPGQLDDASAANAAWCAEIQPEGLGEHELDLKTVTIKTNYHCRTRAACAHQRIVIPQRSESTQHPFF